MKTMTLGGISKCTGYKVGGVAVGGLGGYFLGDLLQSKVLVTTDANGAKTPKFTAFPLKWPGAILGGVAGYFAGKKISRCKR